MAKQIATRTYEDAVAWLKDHGFDILEAPGVQNRVFVKKYNSSAAIEATPDGEVKILPTYPGYMCQPLALHILGAPSIHQAVKH